MRAPRVRPAAVTALTGLVGLVVLTSCGAASYRYINNAKDSTFFKVPSSWTVYRQQSSSATNRVSPPTNSSSGAPWVVVVDSSPTPKAEDVTDFYAAHPVVRAEIGSLSNSGHDAISIADLRQFSTDFKIDPIAAYNNGDPTVEIVSYREITTKSGVRGVHLVFNWLADGVRWATINDSTYVDAKSTRVYRLVIHCESQCFKDNKPKIDAIAASWQVRA